MIRSNETQRKFKVKKQRSQNKKKSFKYILAEDNKWLYENKTQPNPPKAKQIPPELLHRDVTCK